MLLGFSGLFAQTTSESLQIEVKFKEKNPEIAAPADFVIVDTFSIAKGTDIEAFSGNLSLEFRFNGYDDNSVNLQLRMIALPPLNINRFESIESAFGVPFIVDSVLSKQGAIYQAFFTPLEVKEVTYECDYSHDSEGDFYSDPSSDFDIYFVPNSLGDFHWNNIRDHLQYELDQFNDVFSFLQPGKINFYLYPCESPAFAKYKASDYGMHPAKNSIYSVYNHLTDDIPVEAVNMLKLYRYWGYAPRFLVEGTAHLTGFHKFYAGYFKNNEGLYSLSEMIAPLGYDNLEDVFKKRMLASSFVAYISSFMGISTFRDLFTGSTDLNLGPKLEKITAMTIEELEQGWKTYIDTVSYPNGLFHFYAQRALTQKDVSEALFLYETALERNPNDSAIVSYLFNAYYIAGEYEKSAEMIRRMTEFYPEQQYYVTLANMLMSSGQFDSAAYYYDKALESDSLDEIARYKFGQLEFYRNNYENSKKHFKVILDTAKSLPLKIDAHMYLGRMMLDADMPDSAEAHFMRALNGAKNLITKFEDSPLYRLRAGEAATFISETETALEYLQLAEFLELRPFYLGRVLLAEGRAYDLLGDREKAKTYYQHVIDIPAAYFDKMEARKYLSEPFSI